MTAVLKIKGARKAGFRGCSVVAYTHEGHCFTLKHQFASRDSMKLGETLDKVRAAGQINLTFWRPSIKGEY